MPILAAISIPLARPRDRIHTFRASVTANHRKASTLAFPAPFGDGPAIVLTAIAFQAGITAGSAAAGGTTHSGLALFPGTP